MGELEPIAADVVQNGPEAALVRELRTLFEGLGVSQNRYAARVYLDKSVLSRYLSGERIPRWDFVRQLLVESTMKRDGVPPTTEVVKHLRSLHHAALEASGSTAHKLQLLQEQLAEADAQAQRADRRENELERALQDVQRRAADLEVRCRELEDSLDRQESGALLVLRDETDAERAALVAEIERLTQELELAQQRRAAAEARCEELERQLDSASAGQTADSRSAKEPGRRGPERELPEGVDAAAISAAATRITRLSPTTASREIAKMPEPMAAAVLSAMLTKNVTAVIGSMFPERAAGTLSLLEPTLAATVLRDLSKGSGFASVVKHARPQVLAASLDHLSRGMRLEIISELPNVPAAELLDLVEPTVAAEMLSGLPLYTAAEIIELLEPSWARRVFEEINRGVKEAIFAHLDPEMQERITGPQPK